MKRKQWVGDYYYCECTVIDLHFFRIRVYSHELKKPLIHKWKTFNIDNPELSFFDEQPYPKNK